MNKQDFVRVDLPLQYLCCDMKMMMMNSLAFTDYEKAFDRINRSVLCGIICEKGYPKHPLDVIKSLYYEYMSIGEGLTEEMYIIKECAKAVALSPTLFDIYIDDIVRE